ncbi:MAG: tRNA (N6-threonylcarbamoyladenosine(37)-N6)-methyltransferase TrmO [Methanoregulaceae archaeon]|nr:MAG: tRNA (N6-threonylcarbamoyladenosine(37)-N6)-methyltransferase TrmO [Methanoregulaceae archaeon]
MADFTPIGIAHSPFRKAGAPPFQSLFSQAEGRIEIFPEYQEGLMSIDGFSHLIILSHFNRAERQALMEKPLSDGETPHGIFSTRHFNRPNPIGISYVALNSIDKGVLHVTGLDLLEGTPVLDVKPYIPAFDSIPHAITGWVTDRHIENIRKTSIRAQQEIIKNQKSQ